MRQMLIFTALLFPKTVYLLWLSLWSAYPRCPFSANYFVNSDDSVEVVVLCGLRISIMM